MNRTMNLERNHVAACALFFAACGGDISPTNNGDMGDPTADLGLPPGDGGPLQTPRARFETTSATSGTLVVDASDDAAWVYVDLDGRAQVDETSADWDVRFQRFHAALNGGASGSGDVAAAVLDTVFADVGEAPREGYEYDAVDGADEDELPDYVLSGGADPWYDYDPQTHTLRPKARTYVVRTTAGAFVKLAYVDYYAAGSRSSGHPQMMWSVLESPPAAGLVVDASDAERWTYVDLDTMTVVTPVDASNDAVWDLALSRTRAQTNGGTSGAGLGAARLLDQGYDAASTGSMGFVSDAEVPNPGPPGSGSSSGNAAVGTWYDYDAMTHAVRPGDRAYVVRSPTGDYFALRFVSWDDGTIGIDARSLPLEPETVAFDVDASDGASWTYVSLRDAGTVEVDDPANALHWDIGFSRTRARTNSGTTGNGNAGALVSNGSWEETNEAPADPYTVDTTITPAFPPGALSYNANAVLEGWYDYDDATHVVSPAGDVFVVRTADGGYAKLIVTAWDDGVLSLQVLYAGAGRSAL